MPEKPKVEEKKDQVPPKVEEKKVEEKKTDVKKAEDDKKEDLPEHHIHIIQHGFWEQPCMHGPQLWDTGGRRSYICLYMPVLTQKRVFGVSGLVFWESGLVFWVSGLVFFVSGLVCLSVYL